MSAAQIINIETSGRVLLVKCGLVLEDGVIARHCNGIEYINLCVAVVSGYHSIPTASRSYIQPEIKLIFNYSGYVTTGRYYVH